ncbi:MAG: DUF421 domain-containing protein [Oscillospiraceae bacterium]|nr:DUF421 domain-containing protein [Oscillospiraceae bacterium]
MAVSFVRTVILYIVIMASMRLMGKRQLGQLEPSELVVAVLISDLAASPLQDNAIPLMHGLIPVVILVCCEILVSGAVVKSIKFRAFICGKPSVLIKNGVIDQREMHKNRFTIDELTEELRGQGITEIDKVKYAILETDGSLSVLPYPSACPVTASQLGLEPEDSGYPVIIINNGRVLDGNLRVKGLNDAWLRKQLKNRGISSPDEVYLMSVNDLGQIYFSVKEAAK